MTALVVNVRPTIDLTDEQFFQLCQNSPELRIERTATGKPIVMSPTGSETGKRNFNMTTQLEIWAERYGFGVGFDASTGFKPNGADCSPDAAWILNDYPLGELRSNRWNALTPEQQERFARSPYRFPFYTSSVSKPS